MALPRLTWAPPTAHKPQSSSALQPSPAQAGSQVPLPQPCPLAGCWSCLASSFSPGQAQGHAAARLCAPRGTTELLPAPPGWDRQWLSAPCAAPTSDAAERSSAQRKLCLHWDHSWTLACFPQAAGGLCPHNLGMLLLLPPGQGGRCPGMAVEQLQSVWLPCSSPELKGSCSPSPRGCPHLCPPCEMLRAHPELLQGSPGSRLGAVLLTQALFGLAVCAQRRCPTTAPPAAQEIWPGSC